jgi:hypothetical protein
LLQIQIAVFVFAEIQIQIAWACRRVRPHSLRHNSTATHVEFDTPINNSATPSSKMWKIREDGRPTHPRKNTHLRKEQSTKMTTAMLRAAGTATVAQAMDGRLSCKYIQRMSLWIWRTHSVFFVLKTSQLEKRVVTGIQRYV